MKISSKSDYALRTLLKLSLIYNETTLIKMKDIAKGYFISCKFLQQIVTPLKKFGYIQTC